MGRAAIFSFTHNDTNNANNENVEIEGEGMLGHACSDEITRSALIASFTLCDSLLLWNRVYFHPLSLCGAGLTLNNLTV